jgi:hypothetical protein
MIIKTRKNSSIISKVKEISIPSNATNEPLRKYFRYFGRNSILTRQTQEELADDCFVQLPLGFHRYSEDTTK